MIKRRYIPWHEWEEVESNMWGRVEDRQAFLDKAIEFTGNAELYGEYMLLVIDAWPKSCEHNLSNVSQNRQAWIGHAACAYAFQCPEDIVREAWGHLTEQQQIQANQKADAAIAEWERRDAEENAGNECSRCCEFAYRKNFPIF